MSHIYRKVIDSNDTDNPDVLTVEQAPCCCLIWFSGVDAYGVIDFHLDRNVAIEMGVRLGSLTSEQLTKIVRERWRGRP